MSGADIMAALRDGVERHRRGRLDEARRLYDEVLARAPDHPDALHLKGLIAAQTGAHAEAVSLIARAIAGDDGDAEYHNHLGVALRHLGRLAEAEASYRRAIALQPDFAEAHANLGIVRFEATRDVEVVGHFRDALDSRPDYALALCCLGSLHFERGEFADARARLDAAARSDRGYGFARACHFGAEFERRTADDLFDALIATIAPLAGDLPAANGAGPVVMTSCDPVFFRAHGRALLLSLDRNAPGSTAHLHLFDADEAALAAVRAFRAQLPATAFSLSWEPPAGGTAYYVNIRFVRMYQVLEACCRDVFHVDTDALCRAPLAALWRDAAANDVTIPLRPGNVQIQLKTLGGAIYLRATPSSRIFLRRLAAYMLDCARDGELAWFLDQAAIHIVATTMRSAGQ